MSRFPEEVVVAHAERIINHAFHHPYKLENFSRIGRDHYRKLSEDELAIIDTELKRING